jgi:hypothetical protein
MQHELHNGHGGFLRLCSNVCRFCGFLALFGVFVLTVLMLFGVGSGAIGHAGMEAANAQPLSRLSQIVFSGLLLLVVAEFFSFLLASEDRPKWILRHGDKIIYAYILYFILLAGYNAVRGLDMGDLGPIEFRDVIGYSLPIMSVGLKALIWGGMAVALRRVISIIGESKRGYPSGC